MSEFREQLSRIVEAALACQFGDRKSCDKFDSELESAKALLARPEPDIEEEVKEGVWQLKLEGDRENSDIFQGCIDPESKWTDLSEPAAAEKAREWRPIETAPRGGKWILLWWPAVTDAPFVGYRVDDAWCAATNGCRWPLIDGPTHWMPLPSPPAATGETK